MSIQLRMVVIGREHTADACRIKGCQATLIVMGVGMLVISATIGRDAKGSLHRTASNDMIAHIDRSAIHRTLFARGVEEVDQLARTRRDAAEVTYVTGQTNCGFLDRVFGEEQLAIMVVQQQRGAIHLRVQQCMTRHRTAVDTHTVEAVLVLFERVTGNREHILVAYIPLTGRLGLIDHIVVAIIQVMTEIGRLVPVAEELTGGCIQAQRHKSLGTNDRAEADDRRDKG